MSTPNTIAANDEHLHAILPHLVKGLRVKDPHTRERNAQELTQSVSSLGHQLSTEAYNKLLAHITLQLFELLQSNSELDQLGGLVAIHSLIEIATEDQIIRFANYLRNFIGQSSAPKTRNALLVASKALGHLACVNSINGNGISGTLVAACVDFEVKRAFEWLQGDRQDPIFSQRRLAACFVLQELARSAPTLFHVNLTTFFQSIWGAIRDPRVEIREAATQALSACLELIAQRQTRHRVQWYCKVYDQVFEGLRGTQEVERAHSRDPESGRMNDRSKPSAFPANSAFGIAGTLPSPVVSTTSRSVISSQRQVDGKARRNSLSNLLNVSSTPHSWEAVHGSLLVIAGMLKNTGGFMIPRFQEVCETVLRYKDAKNKLVSRTVCLLLPQLSAFCPNAFVGYYLEATVQHLIKRISSSSSTLSSASKATSATSTVDLALSVSGMDTKNRLSCSPEYSIIKLGLTNSEFPLNSITVSSERGIAFFALGQLALAVGKDDILPFLDDVLVLIKESLSPYNVPRISTKSGTSGLSARWAEESMEMGLGLGHRQSRHKQRNKLFCIESWPCVANFAKSLGTHLGNHICELLDIMLQSELTEALVEALTEIVAHVPLALPIVQERLLNEISIILRGLPFFGNGAQLHEMKRHNEELLQSKKSAMQSTFAEHESRNEMDIDLDPAGDRRSDSSASSSSALWQSDTKPSLDRKATGLYSLFTSITMGKFGGSSHSDSTPIVESASINSPLRVHNIPPHPIGSSASPATIIKGETRDEVQSILLSLKTLGCFDWNGNFCLLPFTRDCVAVYLQNAESSIRQQAVTCCSKLILPSIRSSLGQGILPIKDRWCQITKRGPSGRVIDSILQRLLQVSLSDTDVNVRLSVVCSLDSQFDTYLCQEQHLSMLLLLLNDEQACIRENAMKLLERVAARNPALVMPSLRRILVQLLTELKHAPLPPKDYDLREQSTRLLGLVISAAPHIVTPYLMPILQILIPSLIHESNASLVSAVLITLGQLAAVSKRQLEPFEPYLFPIVIYTLQDLSALEKRQIALQTLGILAGNTGCVVRPYLAFPSLLERLLTFLQHSAATPWIIRRETMKTIGIIGALDPYKYKLCLSSTEWLIDHQHLSNVEAPARSKQLLVLDNSAGVNSNAAKQAQLPLRDPRDTWIQKLKQDFERLGIPIDIATFQRSIHTLDVLDEKQQIELQLFTAAPIGTRQHELKQMSSSTKPLDANANVGGDTRQDAKLRIQNRHFGLLHSLGADAAEQYLETFNFEGWLSANEHILDPSELSPSSDAYFPTVAIHALLGILKDSSLGMHHHGVIQAIMFIFKSLSMQCVPFLKYIVPPFLSVLRQSEIKLRETLFLQLTQLIIIVQHHMQPFFPPIVYLALRYWSHHVVEIIRLIIHLAQACSVHDFRQTYLPALLPKIMQELHPPTAVMVSHQDHVDKKNTLARAGLGMTSSSVHTVLPNNRSTCLSTDLGRLGSMNSVELLNKRNKVAAGASSSDITNTTAVISGGIAKGNRTMIVGIQTQVVQALILFKDALDDYVYLVVPALMRLLEHVEVDVQVKLIIIYALARICCVIKFEHYVGSRILQPLARTLRQFAIRDSIFTRAGTTISSWANGTSTYSAAGGASVLSASTTNAMSHCVSPSATVSAPMEITKNHRSNANSKSTKSFFPSSSYATVFITRNEAKCLTQLVIYALAAIAYQLQREFLNFGPLVELILDSIPITPSQAMISFISKCLDTLRREQVIEICALNDPCFSNTAVETMHNDLKAVLSSSAATTSAAIGYSGLSASPSTQNLRLHVNQQNLRRAWEASQRSTKEDWMEWMRRFSIELLRESPCASLRSCCSLAQAYSPLAMALINSAFVSCWNELCEQYQDYLVRALESAFQSETIPPEILQTLLNLAEFMEHDVEALPIDIRELGALAQKCHAYAKALHYKELEFHTSPSTCIEALISINNQLDLPEAAAGILKYAQQHHQSVICVKETWLEKLQNWQEALDLYNSKLEKCDSTQSECYLISIQAYIGKMRCLEALGRWNELASLAAHVWEIITQSDIADPRRQGDSVYIESQKTKHLVLMDGSAQPLASISTAGMKAQDHDNIMYRAAMLGAQACWCLSRWDEMAKYMDEILPDSPPNSNATNIYPNITRSSLVRENTAPAITIANDSLTWSHWQFGSESEAYLFRSALAVRHNQFQQATRFIDTTRKLLDAKLGALVGDSYERAYPTMLTLQQLSELEEIMAYKQLKDTEESQAYKDHLVDMWRDRLFTGCKREVNVWQHILAVRSIILTPQEDVDTWLEFASLCRQSGNLGRSLTVFTDTLGVDERQVFMVLENAGRKNHYAHLPLQDIGFGEQEANRIVFAYLKYLWADGQKKKALATLQQLIYHISCSSPLFAEKQADHVLGNGTPSPMRFDNANSGNTQYSNAPITKTGRTMTPYMEEAEKDLIVKCHLKLAEWHFAFHEQQLDQVAVAKVLQSLRLCTELKPQSYKAWHSWALMNFHVVDHLCAASNERQNPFMSKRSLKSDKVSCEMCPQETHSDAGSMTLESKGAGPYIASAVEGFFRSIALGRSRWAAIVQQDILRVLTLWFTHGDRTDVCGTLERGFQSVSIETWLIVIPQLIARIHTPYRRIKNLLHDLLRRIGAQHPHALIYPLSVALKSPLEIRRKAAEAIMNSMRKQYNALVEEALLVSRELIRIAILWHEMWHEGLEEASRLYFGEHDVQGMVAVLKPLHQMMENGPETLREVSFQQAFGRELREAYDWLQRFLAANNENGNVEHCNEINLNRAWDLYYHVFRRINKQLPQLTTLELHYVSPNLLHANHFQLAVPGTYRAGHRTITIESFVPTIQVITSKQRPRRITMIGSDGLEYMFLLKGHEDLRQDERVTQLFGLVNALLINDRTTSKKELRIHRYPVIPLSHNAGIVGWVPNCDTLHQLIRNYREARKILLNIEHRLMLQMAPDYNALTLHEKVEVFEYALENTAGQDLYKVLWLKSENSQVWLDRRTNYTRSLAVMSMVGYILGLGDRHPSNLMLHRFSGTIVHIDFGDCFEVAMQREKYPEKIPFRLTRMLTNAMEVSGIEGNFRSSCERVMRVLRENRHSLMAMLEAFVHDPLICWRLLAPTGVSQSRMPLSNTIKLDTETAPANEFENNHFQLEGVHAAGINKTKSVKPVIASEEKLWISAIDKNVRQTIGFTDKNATTAETQKNVTKTVEGILSGDRMSAANGTADRAHKAQLPPRAGEQYPPLPPRPTPSTVGSFRSMSVSKSIAFTRNIRKLSVTGPESDASDLDSDKSTQFEKVDHTRVNLHESISSLAASVTSEGQGSLHQHFAKSMREARQSIVGSAATCNIAKDSAEINRDADIGIVAKGTSTTATQPRNRRASFSQQVQAETAQDKPKEAANGQSQASTSVHANRSHRERELVNALGPEGAAAPQEALNEKAVAVIRRVQAKLTGRDFEDDKEPLDAGAQVQRLIAQATSHENLCQCYIGWCPFW